MDPKTNSETDPLIKSLIPSAANRYCNKKRTVITITIVLVLLTIYLIITSKYPSLKLNNKNNINELNRIPTIGTDPFTNWDECNSLETPPNIISYHIHAIFDGNDQNSITYAYEIYHNFINYINPSISQCLFSHSTGSLTQTEICYFPVTWQETDFPIPINFIFQTSNYAFYIPPIHLEKTISYWIQYTNNIQWVIHTVSGCQFTDHTKYLLTPNDNINLVTDNLLCCHNGPTLCTCNIVQYQLNDKYCLGIDNELSAFIYTECESASDRNIGSWREVVYNKDKNWYQIENYGNQFHPIYLCLGIGIDNENDICDIGNEIQLMDCSYKQDIEKSIWISTSTQFMYDVEKNQMKILACNDQNLCVKVNEDESQLKLTVASCEESTVFMQRYFFP
eukprot:524375_1